MRRWYYQGLIARVLIGLACLVPAGCADQRSSITPAESLALLPTGRPVLSCREACLSEWQRAQPQAAQLDAGRRSEEVALLVMRIGYQDEPDVPGALTLCRKRGLLERNLDLEHASYIVSRMTIAATDAPGMNRWGKKIFITMARNAADPIEHFGLPSERTVIMGSRVAL